MIKQKKVSGIILKIYLNGAKEEGDKMNKKEKKQLELQIKQILYFVEKKEEQDKMINLLTEYNDKLPDGKFKDGFQKWALKFKNDYYDRVDHLVGDIFDGTITNNDKKIIQELLQKIRPVIEEAEKNLWQKFVDLMNWS